MATKSQEKQPLSPYSSSRFDFWMRGRGDSFRRSSINLIDWKIPKNYDYSKSTRNNYGAPRSCEMMFGPYADIRAQLDLIHHGNYIESRQRFQDTLICDVLGAGTPKSAPWIVFTAGAMGAGKGHTISWMAMHLYFPLPDLVQLDPDVFKVAFPEWEGYLLHDKLAAGFNTRLESGMMVEIAQEAALRTMKNIWVDGSFRDDAWYADVFKRIRKDHPSYRIAILYVYAEPEVVKERARQRSLETGRFVPQSEIEDSLRRVPRAVNRLAPKADFVAHIENSGSEPELTDFCTRDGCFINVAGSWSEISNRFATLPGLGDDDGSPKERQWQCYVKNMVESEEVVMFSKTYCSYCKKLKALLHDLCVAARIAELDLMADAGTCAQLELAKMTSVWTVPQLWAHGKFIGGCNDALDLHAKGELVPALKGR